MSRARPLDGFAELPDTHSRGRLGEEEAERWLVAEGYRIVERNVTNRAGEIDRIAIDSATGAGADGTLCFIEIKARASAAFGSAIEAVSASKQRRIARAAALYLARHPTERPCRFDVLGMDRIEGRWRFTLVRDAFEAG